MRRFKGTSSGPKIYTLSFRFSSFGFGSLAFICHHRKTKFSHGLGKPATYSDFFLFLCFRCQVSNEKKTLSHLTNRTHFHDCTGMGLCAPRIALSSLGWLTIVCCLPHRPHGKWETAQMPCFSLSQSEVCSHNVYWTKGGFVEFSFSTILVWYSPVLAISLRLCQFVKHDAHCLCYYISIWSNFNSFEFSFTLKQLRVFFRFRLTIT